MHKGTALITGASSGIGKELAERFARDGHDLVLVARSAAKLEELAVLLRQTYGVNVLISVQDLAKPEAPRLLEEELRGLGIAPDVLVNNAGYGLYGPFLETDMADELGMIDLNVRALTELIKRFVPGMVQRGHGGILNVASVASFEPGPLMAVYYATKAYVLSLTEALENELGGTGVTVTALCPGPTATGFGERAQLNTSKLFKSGVMDVAAVAEEGYQGFKRGKTIVVPGLQYKLLTKLVGFLPRKLVTKIVRQMQEKV